VRALAERYQQSLAAVVYQQRERYAALLVELSTPLETLTALQTQRDALLAASRPS
jgi:hypothetical protein